MVDIQDLSEFLTHAIKQAKPKPIGNVKQCKADRRSFWLEAIGELKVSEQEESQCRLHASNASYIEPTAEQAEAIIKQFAHPAKF